MRCSYEDISVAFHAYSPVHSNHLVKHLLKPSMAQDSGFLSLASTYPENLNSQIFWNCNLGSSRLRLDNEATRLFVEEPSANVGVVNLNGADTGMLHATSNPNIHYHAHTCRILRKQD
jgi:hypothetical protein